MASARMLYCPEKQLLSGFRKQRLTPGEILPGPFLLVLMLLPLGKWGKDMEVNGFSLELDHPWGHSLNLLCPMTLPHVVNIHLSIFRSSGSPGSSSVDSANLM